LLYGCKTGAGVLGKRFVEGLAILTQAKVFASESLVGNTALGGSWELTVRSARDSEPLAVFRKAILDTYEHVLAIPYLVRDLPGPIDSLTDVSNTAFFTVNGLSPDKNRELWKSDGTEAGTSFLKSFPPKPYFPGSLTIANGTVFFAIDDGTNGIEPWKSDGTSAGTTLVKDIYEGSESSLFSGFTNVNGTIFFPALDKINGLELWKSDGTNVGTSLVKDINNTGGQSSLPANLTNVNGTLFFTAYDNVSRKELWKSDGTEAGTTLVKDITTPNFFVDAAGPSKLTNVSGTLFFEAFAPDKGRELWKSDGTEGGTVLVRDVNPGSGNSDIKNLTNFNGSLFFNYLDFNAANGTFNNQLWRSDGTESGTVVVKGFSSSQANIPDPKNLTVVNNTLFFTVDDGVNGEELWKSDGTAEGTVLVKDITSGSGSTIFDGLVKSNGTLFFIASGDIWKSDGTEAGTQRITGFFTSVLDLDNLTSVGKTLFFTRRDGEELWVLENDIPNPNPNPSTLLFSASEYSVNEIGTTITPVTVLRSGSSEGEVSVTVVPSNGTATAPDDYNNSPITVTFADGDTTPKTVNLPINNDSLTEQNETINLTLKNPAGEAILGVSTSTLTIIDDDNPTQINIEDVALQERNVKTGQWISISKSPVYETKTIDGNLVKITPKIRNQENRDITVKVRVTETVENRDVAFSQVVNVPANGSFRPEFFWNTNGFAWDPRNKKRSASDIRIIVEDVSSGTQLATRGKFVEVQPKPVVLLHGLFSDFKTWKEYDSFVKAVNPQWSAFAVGDREISEVPGVVDTGELSVPELFRQTKSTSENAYELGKYIKGVREKLNAESVDLVVHSQGGLISRRYIQNAMPRSQDGKPVVNRLLMLGTPNGGAKAANFRIKLGPLGPTVPISVVVPALRELTTPYVGGYFNKAVTNRMGVPFSILAGTLLPTPGVSTLLLGDSIVPYESAVFNISDRYISTFRYHAFAPISMTNSQEDFTNFVLPRLARDTSEVGNTNPFSIVSATDANQGRFVAPNKINSSSGNSKGDAINSDGAVKPSNLNFEQDQLFFGTVANLYANSTTEVDIVSPSGTNLVITYITPDNIGATLINPNGNVAATNAAGSPESGRLINFFDIKNPISGNYKLRFEQHNGTASKIPVVASIVGNPLNLKLDVAQPDAEDQSKITATLINDGVPLTGATLQAEVAGIETDYQKTLTLFDDGQNGDGQAGDGVYGVKTDPLTGGPYNVAVSAQGPDFQRFTSGILVTREPDRANLDLQQVELIDSGVVGENISYTFKVSNIGPKTATGIKLVNTLPTGVDFVSASAGATYDPNTRNVTFDLGNLDVDDSTTANVVVKRTMEGGLKSVANLTAAELDPDLSNNTFETTESDFQLAK
jgi:uncharacterized repeat protein (TIGR01451 family)